MGTRKMLTIQGIDYSERGSASHSHGRSAGQPDCLVDHYRHGPNHPRTAGRH